MARLATVTPSGRPHVVPAVFAPVGDVLASPIDGKRKRSRHVQRLRNVASGFSLLLDHYEADWRALWWVRLDGEVEVVEAGGFIVDAEDALGDKYPQYRETPLRAAPEPCVLKLRWRGVTGWAEGDLDEVLARQLS